MIGNNPVEVKIVGSEHEARCVVTVGAVRTWLGPSQTYRECQRLKSDFEYAINEQIQISCAA